MNDLEYFTYTGNKCLPNKLSTNYPVFANFTMNIFRGREKNMNNIVLEYDLEFTI